MALVDVVVVSYNSRQHLRRCVEPLVRLPDVRLIVVDNASSDRSLETIADLPIERLQLEWNGGFAHGCNVGWRSGDAPFVLFLNPDATIDQGSVHRLVTELERDPSIGAAAPCILNVDGTLDLSLRRFPRLRSTWAQALFLHRLVPNAGWVDEVIRDLEAYDRPGPAQWVSGACILVRRTLLAALEGLDEGFFLYCEDIDLCRRIWKAGSKVHYVPEAIACHEGGGSLPRTALLPVLAASRIRYAKKHRRPLFVLCERLGVITGAVTHALIGRGGAAARLGHLRALRVACSRLGAAPSRLARDAQHARGKSDRSSVEASGARD